MHEEPIKGVKRRQILRDTYRTISDGQNCWNFARLDCYKACKRTYDWQKTLNCFFKAISSRNLL